MKLRLVLKDVFELLLLIIGFWFVLGYFGKGVAGHDKIVVFIPFVVYSAFFILNLILQVVTSIRSTKSGIALYAEKAKRAACLCLPSSVATVFLHCKIAIYFPPPEVCA